MHKCLRFGLLAAVTIALGSAPRAAEKPSASEFEAMRRELETLKQGQEVIGNNVAEILKILEAVRPPPPVRPIDAIVPVGDSPYKGSKDARLTLIEFSDYECPYCKRHVDTTLPQLEKEYIATGKLRYVFRDFPLESIHKQAFKAAEASHCASEQQKYWEMHDRLFANQDALAPGDLVEHARAIGLEARPFRKCLDSGRYADVIRRSVTEGKKLGITGTPAILLGTSDGSVVKEIKFMAGALPFAIFKKEIDQLLSPAPVQAQN
jgi:protein-disulfide isomerase